MIITFILLLHMIQQDILRTPFYISYKGKDYSPVYFFHVILRLLRILQHYTSPRCSQKLVPCHFEMRDCKVYKRFQRISHNKLLRNPVYCFFSLYSTNKYANNDCETLVSIIQIVSYQIIKLPNCQVPKLMATKLSS